MWKQISRVAAAAAAAAVEIPVLQRAPLACFMCVNVQYWAILHMHFKQLRVSPVQWPNYTQCYWSVDVHEENVITAGQSAVFFWKSQRGILLLLHFCRASSPVHKQEIKLNLFAEPVYYFISDNKSQAVKKPVYHDWTIDHVKTCIVSFHSSILTAFTRLACDLISVCLTQLNCWHLNIENRILVSDCHRWSVLLNNTISRKVDLTRLE